VCRPGAAVLVGLAVVAGWHGGWSIDAVIALGIAACSAWRDASRGERPGAVSARWDTLEMVLDHDFCSTIGSLPGPSQHA
jgi:hypothetical protein